MTPEQDLEAAVWLQVDAAYLYAQAAAYRDSQAPAAHWFATKLQENAAHSAALARAAVERAAGAAA